MPYKDTHKHDFALEGVSPHDFDEISLASRLGHHYGEMVWHKVKLVKASPRGAPVEAELRNRLIVFVDDERSPESIKAVRLALGLREDEGYST